MTAASSVLELVRSLVPLFFFNDTATTEIYTLSLHDALPISLGLIEGIADFLVSLSKLAGGVVGHHVRYKRSEEHTSELQSLAYLVCRLLLEKKNARNGGVVGINFYPVFLDDHFRDQDAKMRR